MIEYYCGFACSVLFLFGSVYFVWLSYPEEMEKMQRQLVREDASQLSCVERYFTGTDMLIATWFFLISGAPYLGYAVYMMALRPDNPEGWLVFLGCIVYFLVMLVWVLGTMPENIQEDEGRGSTRFLDYVIRPICCCCWGPKNNAFWRRHFSNDVMAGTWLFFYAACAMLIYSIYTVVVNHDSYAWLSLGSNLGFALGAAIMVYTMYPEVDTERSAVVWNFLTCDKSHLMEL
eukprot:FR736977.1.p1 GENE.FR736977.1~~FR736977.1.p1  ORF type:complete len:255 (+),score=30.53 FR736977.1:72-767(+)